ncbi:MAG: hypothetical protein R3C25_09030 [Hyphomonadaceae bacterium]
MDLTEEFLHPDAARGLPGLFAGERHDDPSRAPRCRSARDHKNRAVTIEGENDDISGIGQTQAAHDICANIPEAMRRDYIQPGVGHYGVFSGRRFKAEIYPRVRDFMRAFQSPASRAKPKLKVVS